MRQIVETLLPTTMVGSYPPAAAAPGTPLQTAGSRVASPPTTALEPHRCWPPPSALPLPHARGVWRWVMRQVR